MYTYVVTFPHTTGRAAALEAGATVYDSAGVALASQPVWDVNETPAGSGDYLAVTTQMPDGQVGAVRFLDGSQRVEFLPVSPPETEGALTAALAALLATAAAVDPPTTAEIRAALVAYAAQVGAALAGTSITLYRGDSWSIPLTGLGDLTGNAQLWFTAKRTADEADSAARVQVTRTGGLLVLAGSAYGTAGHGSITVDDAAAGDVTVAVDEAATALLGPGNWLWDVQMLNGGDVSTLAAGQLAVLADVTRATG